MTASLRSSGSGERGLPEEARRALRIVRSHLMDQRNERGHWRGRLSSSALSTAVAVSALSLADSEREAGRIEAGVRWLSEHPCAGGGWGDTPESPASLSTTLLCLAALGISGAAGEGPQNARARAESWVAGKAGGMEPHRLVSAVLHAYGEDRTFSAPILTTCALAGMLGPEEEAWRRVPQLPFELAALPRRLFGLLRLDVVSYALPALIAVGMVRHVRHPAAGDPRTLTRSAVRNRVLRILREIQPENGGFLEATPLTAFVALSLSGAGLAGHPVTRKCTDFLTVSQREDGSWPIDTDLAVWVTTQAVNALDPAEEEGPSLASAERSRLRDWLLESQTTDFHPYTGAAPGGWAWTDLPGGVPDADDTSGALLALHRLGREDPEAIRAVEDGIRWLLGVANADGGFPTFCRGWGRLPFDRSCPDITAHALNALSVWKEAMPSGLRREIGKAIERGLRYLEDSQERDGAWLPLWFGSQHTDEGTNPTYGTARVLGSLASLETTEPAVVEALLDGGRAWLEGAQNPDGGWGGGPGAPSSMEETGLALGALSGLGGSADAASLARGIRWLVSRIEGKEPVTPSPIGLYFASLWYDEALYPWIFSAWALRRWLVRRLRESVENEGTATNGESGCGERNA